MAVGMILSLVAGMGGGVLSQALPLGALSNWSSSFWNNLIKNERLDPQTIMKLRLYGILDDDTYYEQMGFQGFTKERADLLQMSSSNWLDPVSVIRAGWREGHDDVFIVADLVAHGWLESEAERYLTAAKFYPGPADLINFQAKEVFEPAMVAKYGLTAELEGLERDAFYKAGMDDEQIENYWKAHWQHPAFTQATQMMHRDQMTEEELWDWFRLMEVPPYWRQKMINIAYKPFTRVDVRRMHKIGLMEEKDLTRAYMDLGYDRPKAEDMTAFTLKYNQEVGEDPNLDLTRAMFEKAYRLGMLSPTEFHKYLLEIGYDEDNASFIGAMVDQDVSLDRAYDWITLLRNQVGARLITVQEAGQKLTNLGLSDDAVSHYEVIFSNYVAEPSKIPSKTDVKNWLSHGTIEDTEAGQFLEALGYGSRYIYLYIKDWTGSEERYEEWVQKMRTLGQN